MTERHVKIDNRHFIVKFDGEKLLLIKERVVHEPGRPWECFFNKSVWHHAHHVVPTRRDALYRRVVDAARAML